MDIVCQRPRYQNVARFFFVCLAPRKTNAAFTYGRVSRWCISSPETPASTRSRSMACKLEATSRVAPNLHRSGPHGNRVASGADPLAWRGASHLRLLRVSRRRHRIKRLFIAGLAFHIDIDLIGADV